MAGESSLDELSARLQALEREAEGVSAALAQAKNSRRVLVVLLLIFIGGFGYLFYQKGSSFINDKDKLLAEIEKRADPLKEDVVKRLQSMAERVGPKVSEAFSQQAKKDANAYLAALQKEREPLRANLEAKIRDRVQAHHAAILQSHRNILKTELEITDDKQLDRMVDNFNTAIQESINKHYVEAFKREITKLYKTLDDFPPAPAPKPGDLPLTDQLVGHLMEIMIIKASERAPAVGAAN